MWLYQRPVQCDSPMSMSCFVVLFMDGVKSTLSIDRDRHDAPTSHWITEHTINLSLRCIFKNRCVREATKRELGGMRRDMFRVIYELG